MDGFAIAAKGRDCAPVLQVPAARGACLLPLFARLGAFFNPKRLNHIEL